MEQNNQTVNGHVPNGSLPNGSASSKTSKATKFAYEYVTFKRLACYMLVVSLVLTYYLWLPFYAFPVVVLLVFIPCFSSFIGINSFLYQLYERRNQFSKIDKYIEFLDEDVKAKYSGKFIPIRDLYEYYADGKINLKGDVLQCLERRNEYISYRLQWWHLKFFLSKLLPELFHAKEQDRDQVTDHYDRGNDFYASFLGPMMIYTSGIRKTENDTLEDMQRNKLDDVFRKIQLKEGERHLDIGCGWGTLSNAAANECGALSTGVSIAERQIEYAEEVALKGSADNRAKFLCKDYREIPRNKYNKITCLEMAEHVGIRLFPSFLEQVREMLEDNGIFFLQIAGLRRAWQWEDMLWGFFMDTYIFPGADASLPLTFSVGQLETCGFEIQSVETVGIHYSDTIKYWYQNWVQPETEEQMVGKYGKRLYRIWEIFLSWSTIIARQGNSTCFQIVAHKNLNSYPRKQFMNL